MTAQVSVIVPVYNESAADIAATVNSALRAIAYDGGKHEVIVIDDGSACAAMVPISPYVKVYHKEHEGIAAACNYGVRMSNGYYVTVLSVRDSMYQEKIKVMREMMEYSAARAAFHAYVGQDHGAQKKIALHAEWADRLETDNQFCLGMAMWERSIHTVDGLWFDEHLQWCTDWDFACHVEFRGPGWVCLDVALGEAYEHPGGHTDRAHRDKLLSVQRSQNRATVLKRWRRARLNN